MEEIDVNPLSIIMQGGKTLGTAQLTDEGQQALRNAGFEVGDGRETGEAVELTQECEVDNPRPCELTVALGMAQYLGREAGVDTSEADALEARGSATEEEARQAVEAIVSRFPEDMRPQGQALIEEAFGGGPNGGS